MLTSGNPDAKRLFDDLLSSYNKLVRPVMNVTDAVTVKFKLKLSQLIDVVSGHQGELEGGRNLKFPILVDQSKILSMKKCIIQ